MTLRSLQVTSTHMRVPATGVVLLAAVVSLRPSGGCNKPTVGQHPAVEDDREGAGTAARRARGPLACPRSCAPRRRSRWSTSGAAEEVDTVIAGLPADDRAEIAKTLIPGYEAAMTAQGAGPVERALDYRDALFSLRQSVPADGQEADRRRPAARAGDRLQGGQAAPGPALAGQDADRHRPRIERDAGRACWGWTCRTARRRTCSRRSATRPSRDKGAAALIARAPEAEGDGQAPGIDLQGAGDAWGGRPP